MKWSYTKDGSVSSNADTAWVDEVAFTPETTTYTVTYNGNGNNGGSAPTDSNTYSQSDTVTVLGNTGNLTKNGYTFAGWNTAANGSGTNYSPSATFNMGSSNVTLHAKWAALPTYTVSYSGNGNNGGSVPTDSSNYYQSDTVTVLANTGNLTKTGYTFSGWNTAANGSGTNYSPSATFNMGSSNVTLYAKWTALPTYTVSYNGNGNTSGSSPSNQTKTSGVDLALASNSGNLAKSGYSFEGWNTSSNGSGTDYAEGANYSLNANLTLYAKWNSPPSVDAGSNQTVSLEAGGAAWTPDSISTTAWYDAADASSITASGGSVSQWNDKSGNGNHATQSNSSIQPVTGSKSIGGKNVIDFETSNNQSLVIPSIDVIGKEVWAVFIMDDYTTTSSQLLLGGGGNVQIGVNSSTQSLRLWSAGNPYSADTKSTANIPVTTPTLAAWLAHTDTKKFSINGALEVTNNTYQGGSMNATNIGRGQYATMDGAIGEIIVTSSELSTEDRQKIEGYLAHKWGLQANLPAGHPYKISAPGDGSAAVVNLDGTINDPEGDPYTSTWSVVSGPAGVNFADESAEDTTASFTAVGTYVLELTAGGSSDQVTITVNDGSNSLPTVDAGVDQTVLLEASSGGWSPESISTTAWFDATDSSSITQSGGSVSQWNDKSGNAHHATSSGSSMPSYNSSDSRLNNQPSIGYNQGYKFLTTPTIGAIKNVYVVTYYDDPDNAFNSHRVLFSDTGNTTKIQGKANGDSWVSGKGFNFHRDGSTTSSDNGALPMGPTMWTAKGTASHTNKNWRILGGQRNYQYWEYGAVAEMILTDGTEDLETQQKIEGYLAHKWGLEANLPAEHPYKNEAPGGGGTATVVNLDGTVIDPDNDPFTSTWSVISGPATVDIANTSAVDTTATFTALGSYVLELTASDNNGQSSDQVTITVTDGSIITTTVPNVVGQTQATAESSIVAANLVLGNVAEAYSTTVAAGNVISQTPSGGTTVDEGTSVDLVVSIGLDSSPKLVRTTVNNVSNTGWTTVDLGQTYASPVVIATPIYPTGVTTPVVTRINNITATGFDLKLDRADGLTGAVSFDVSVIAVEEGVYTPASGGVTMEAVKFTSSVTAGKSNWVATARSYQNSYTNPVVLGQIMSANDANWSAFWCMGSSQGSPPDASNLSIGKHIGEDPNKIRANEVIGYIVIESGTGSIDGVNFEAGLGSDIVLGLTNSTTPYTYNLSGSLNSASAAAVSQAAMDGGDGSWAVLAGSAPFSPTSIGVYVAEDILGDSEQGHTSEQVGYIVFE